MYSRVATLRDLVTGSLYVVDEHAVARALVARALVKEFLPQQEFRSEARWAPVRSFRRERGARSFRLCSRTQSAAGRR